MPARRRRDPGTPAAGRAGEGDDRRPDPRDPVEGEVERLETRHDRLCRCLASMPLAVALAAAFGGFVVVCRDCNLVVALVLALGLVAVFTTFLGIVSTLAVFGLYPVIAAWLSPGYRAVRRYREALERHASDRPRAGGPAG